MLESFLKYFQLNILIISIFFNVFCSAEQDSHESYRVILDKAKLPILTPSFSERKTLKIRLNNGLEAILISDPKADMSSAVLSVNVGSWEDPEEYPGIAHFLEHMLFLGTKQFPKESEYQQFISDHGGASNAFTANDRTSYLFSIENGAFTEALDRFASFFKDPLFNPSGVSRELNAIDQEFAKNIENDDFRLLFVLKELANPKHPYHRFNIGNSKTLSNVSQETLKNWYKRHYSAQNMRLAVISTLPMDKLVPLVVKNFEGVPKNDVVSTIPNISLATNALEGKIVYVQPIKNIRTLTFVWDLPTPFGRMKETRPDDLICSILGHEGKESLLVELKRLGFAEKLNCGGARVGGNHLNFYLEVELTDEGVRKVNEVIQVVFEMIKVFKEKGVPQYVFQDTQKIEKLKFQYQSREDAFDTAMKMASTLWDEGIETFPEQGLIIQRFDPKDAEALLGQLTPRKAQIFVSAPSSLTGIKPAKIEKWMGVEYAIGTVPEKTMTAWENPLQEHVQLGLAGPNRFIPDHLALIPMEKLNANENLPLIPHPKAIVDTDKAKIYYALDGRYKVPKGFWNFEIKSPEIQAGKPSKVVLADLFVKSLKEALGDFTYDAVLAGLEYKIERKEYGIKININGYSEKVSMLFDEILKQIKTLNVTEEQFNIYKQSLLRDYQNFTRETPLRQASEVLKSGIYKSYATEQQKASAIRKVTYEKFTGYLQTLFKEIFVQGMIYGNVVESEALKQSEMLLGTFSAAPYPVSEQNKLEVILLPNNLGPFYFEEKTKASGNAVILAIEYVPYSFEARAAHQILMQAVNQPFFGALRTKQQTGYIVYSSGEELERHLFHLFAVQSNSHEVRDLLARFELFIESYLQEIGKTELLEADFQIIKQSIITQLEQPQNNANEMGELLTVLAFKYDGDFDWMNKRIDALKKMEYPEFIAYAKQALGRQNKRRLAVLLKGAIPEDNVFDYVPLTNINEIRKLSIYQGSN